MSFKPKSVLVFEISSDYAQFRKYFTNMSPLTFSIPPRTVIAGLIGAILGIEKNENPETFLKGNSFISLKIVNPVRKTKVPTNYIKTTNRTHFSRYEQHKPTNVEYLKQPAFRIYFSHKDKDLYDDLKASLTGHKSHYTINLGISSCLANFKYLGEFGIEEKDGAKQVDIMSVAPKKSVDHIVFGQNVSIQQCTLPNIMQNDREVVEYKEFLYEVSGGVITADISGYYKVMERGENIIGM